MEYWMLDEKHAWNANIMYVPSNGTIKSQSCKLAIDRPLVTETNVHLKVQVQSLMYTSCIDYLFIKVTEGLARTPDEQLLYRPPLPSLSLPLSLSLSLCWHVYRLFTGLANP